MDEDEWTDRNFGPSTAELGSSDEYSSSNRYKIAYKLLFFFVFIKARFFVYFSSDTDSDDEDNYEEALEEPATKEGTLRWAERMKKHYSKKDDSDSEDFSSSDHSGYYDNMSDGNLTRNNSICRIPNSSSSWT